MIQLKKKTLGSKYISADQLHLRWGAGVRGALLLKAGVSNLIHTGLQVFTPNKLKLNCFYFINQSVLVVKQLISVPPALLE